MQLNLSRPIVFFDLETTGLDIVNDRIVEISLLKVNPDGSTDSKTKRINPGIPIPPEASAVHGIYDKDVHDCPTFKEVAEEVWAVINGCDLGGYNSNRFDIPLLSEEFTRAGLQVDLRQCRFVDVQNIYHKLERRTLAAAYRFYCHAELTDAHAATADTNATYEVLCAQLDHYEGQTDDKGQPLLRNDIDFLSEFSRMDRNVDFAGRIVYDKDGIETFNFGKHKGEHVVEALRQDPHFLHWMLQGDFPQNTKQVLTEIALRSRSTH